MVPAIVQTLRYWLVAIRVTHYQAGRSAPERSDHAISSALFLPLPGLYEPGWPFDQNFPLFGG